jgi:hypothetical protein
LAILKTSLKLRVRHADTLGAGRAKIGARFDNLVGPSGRSTMRQNNAPGGRRSNGSGTYPLPERTRITQSKIARSAH